MLRWFAGQLARTVLIIAALLIALPAVAYVMAHLWTILVENPRYADEVFSGVRAYDRVLASKKWHGPFDGSMACTYAIVELAEAVPQDPPQAPSDDWRLDFSGEWLPTPYRTVDAEMRDPLAFCAEEWPADVAARLTAALAEQGSWYWQDGIRESVYVYSRPKRIAARVRWGD